MAQIGRGLGVTESRICQLNTIILTRLRTALTGALGTTP